MRKSISVLLCLLFLTALLTGCSKAPDPNSTPGGFEGGDNSAYGDSLDDLNAYDGFFEEDIVDVTINCVSGTEDCYTIIGNTVTFTSITEDSVYSISGKLKGNIIIDVGDDYDFDLELRGFSQVCDSTNAILINSGDKVSITAKSGCENYIYDTRAAIDDTDDTLFSAAIHSAVDLKICGKGALTVISENNKGIHTKDDLQVKNLTLLVYCTDNALKGNDSVTISGGTLTLIATEGDGIKTSNSDISSKGNQKGTVSISGATCSIYAGRDGIDSAYDVQIDEETTIINIYTDRYSAYSSASATGGQPSATPGMNDSEPPAIPGTDDAFAFSLSASSENKAMDLAGRPGGNMPGGNMPGGGMGGMGGNMPGGGMGGGFSDGNVNKVDYSCKGIKAANCITVSEGTVFIKSYDDSIHANGGETLENEETGIGNVTVNGGSIDIYSNDDGIHGDGTVAIHSGEIRISYSYEGIEGTQVHISGGNISVFATDDGVNGTAKSGTAIQISGGELYVHCSGDGLDSNSTSAYTGIVFSGGRSVIFSSSGGNSAIDTEQGYSYTGGSVIAIMPAQGMTNELTHCQNFSTVATRKNLSLQQGQYLCVTADPQIKAVFAIPENISAMVVYLGDNSADLTLNSSCSESLDGNGVFWHN